MSVVSGNSRKNSRRGLVAESRSLEQNHGPRSPSSICWVVKVANDQNERLRSRLTSCLNRPGRFFGHDSTHQACVDTAASKLARCSDAVLQSWTRSVIPQEWLEYADHVGGHPLRRFIGYSETSYAFLFFRREHLCEYEQGSGCCSWPPLGRSTSTCRRPSYASSTGPTIATRAGYGGAAA